MQSRLECRRVAALVRPREAGADVLWTFFYDVLPLGFETGREAAIAVYRAMHAREKSVRNAGFQRKSPISIDDLDTIGIHAKEICPSAEQREDCRRNNLAKSLSN